MKHLSDREWMSPTFEAKPQREFVARDFSASTCERCGDELPRKYRECAYCDDCESERDVEPVEGA